MVVAVERAMADPRPGDLIAGYLRVEALLGRGGAGAVYRVRDERKSRKLALKQLRAPDDERRALLTSQFAREYHTLTQLAHPHIIEVFDYGVDRGIPYYTMELLDGEDLHEQGQLPFRTACALLRDVASSLAVLHSRGLIHRDVSARNVRCTRRGGAKLLDFGAMAQMGSSPRAVGTPPFVAPEVLQMQALDARADLYGLGALAYWTLTGRHAYPAHTFTQLRDAWRRQPRALTDHAPDVPDALVELVLSLLRLEREERPRTAAEVMERLAGIAGLPREELPAVGRAYLVTPSLVGRGGALQESRSALSPTLKTARGTALVIEGARGMGRSRFLDACVLEAKLMGATVLRSGLSDGSHGDYGVVRALIAQLFEAYPELCEQTAEPRAALLAQISPELGPSVQRPGAPAERRHLQVALRDFFLSIARNKHLVIAVDDVHLIDEPSAALLGAIAHGAERRRLTLLLTVLAGGDDAPAVNLLREIGQRIDLRPLDAEQTEALLRSLFGDSPRVATLAREVHPLCHGCPRQLMSLAEHLVGRGVARYEAGSWTLPLALGDEDVPKSDQDALAKRLAALSPDARDLAEALSLTDLRALSLVPYSALTAHEEPGRTFAALDELVRAGLLLLEGERYRLAASDVLAPLASSLAPSRRIELHARLSRVIPPERRPALRLLHMLRGGREREAIAELLSGEVDQLYPGRLDALIAASDAAEQLGLPTRTKLELHFRLARLSAAAGRPDLFDRYGWPLIERLRRDSGLSDFYAFDPELGEARVQQSLKQAQERFDATPPDERGFTPRESITRLVSMHGSGSAVGAFALDLERIERLGSLEPWLDLNPSIRLAEVSSELARVHQKGQPDKARSACSRLLSELERPDGPNAHTAKYTRLAYVNLLAALCAGAGDPACERWIAELETQPGHRGNAWRKRMVYALAFGQLDRAQECERRAELLDLQDSGGVLLQGSTAPSDLFFHALNENIAGVKRALERITELAAVLPGWRPPLSVAQAQYRRLQGDFEGALRALEPALALTAPGRHVSWSFSRDTHLRLLLALGRFEEAARFGLQYVEESARHAVPGEWLIDGTTSEALAAVGRVEEATSLSEKQLREHEQVGIAGIRLGRAYESRARVAIAAKDTATFERCAERCAQELLPGRNPGLRARYERLLREAAAAGISAVPPMPASEPEPAGELEREARDDARTVYSRMVTCISPAERAERALQLLLEATGARTGYFFGLRSSRLELMFNPEGNAAPPALVHMLEECLRREFDGGFSTAHSSGTVAKTQAIAAPIGRFVDELGRDFEPLLLTGAHLGEVVIAGVAALHYSDEARPVPRKAMLDAVIEALISEDVVDPITCVT